MSRKSRKNVGVIGLGIIGARVAAGLRATGYQVYVWNRSAKPAPNFLGSPAEVADAADIVQIFVSDAAALFEVIDAMGDSLTPRHIIVCSGTVGPEAVLEAAQIVEGKGAQFLDAPFTGSKLAAERRQLVYYIGGAEHTFLKAKPVLEVMSKAIVRIGEVGHAASVKVVTNMISAVTTQVLAEALSIVQKAGLEPEVLAAAIEHNACRSGVIDLKLPKMIAGDYEPHFSLKHMFKDVQLGIHMANALDIEVPATTVTAGVMYGALNKGWADLDFSALYKNYASESPEELPALPASTALADAALADELASESRRLRALESGAEPEKVVEEETIVGKEEGTSENRSEPLSASPSPEPAPSHTIHSSAAPAREKLPTFAAAQMIEAVLGHPDGAVKAAEPSSESAKKVEIAPVGDAAPKKPAEPESKTSETDTPVEAKTDEAKTDEAKAEKGEKSDKEEKTNLESPADDAAEPAPVQPQNFVKRWFVARSGG
jgi:3-hydroxyisobutyrate dehydrogenase-like beta-hydroxyacid dehydrogenase